MQPGTYLKPTIGPDGQWITIPVILERTANGWRDRLAVEARKENPNAA